MKVFISWSGARSKHVALALREWLPYVFQSLEPWMSTTDIKAGTRWNNELNEQLSESQFGIICLTSDNLNAPWIMFEAGAIAKTLEGSYVVPYCIDLEPSAIPSGPIAQFQAKRADEQGTYELIQAINSAFNGTSVESSRLRVTFEHFWKDLLQQLSNLPEPESKEKPPERKADEVMQEVLLLVRKIEGSVTRMNVTDELRDPKARVLGQFGTGKTHALGFLKHLIRDGVRDYLEGEYEETSGSESSTEGYDDDDDDHYHPIPKHP